MSQHILEVSTRKESGRKTNQLREEGLVPAVVYGAGVTPQNITVDRNQFVKLYNTAGESSLIELKVNGKDPVHVLIQDYQQDPVTDFVTHIDFHAVDITEEVEAEIKLEFVGESMAVKSLGGVLMKNMNTLTVRAIPTKLVPSIDVDISALETFDDVVRAGDLPLPEGVKIEGDENETVVNVAPPRSEEELEALDEAVEENVDAVAKAGDAEDSEEGEDAEGENKSEESES